MNGQDRTQPFRLPDNASAYDMAIYAIMAMAWQNGRTMTHATAQELAGPPLRENKEAILRIVDRWIDHDAFDGWGKER